MIYKIFCVKHECTCKSIFYVSIKVVEKDEDVRWGINILISDEIKNARK